MITIEKRGILTTVQDLGRIGYQRYGMPTSGAMDAFAMRLSNVLVGNQPETEVLEATVLGPSIRFGEAEIFAVCGGNFNPRLNGQPIRNNKAYLAPAGSLLELPAAVSGARAYIAFAGGLDADLVMNSRSTCIKAGIGGIEGRAARDGDTLALRAPKTNLPRLSMREVPVDFGVSYSARPVVRFTFGPQADMFSEAGKCTFTSEEYKLTPESDRMGFRFSGAEVAPAAGCDGNIVSDGICFGSIQIPKTTPIVMMADHQTSGGYAKIGCVIQADLPLLAQLKVGDSVRFQPVDVERAQDIYLAQRQLLLDLAAHLDAPEEAETRHYLVNICGTNYYVKLRELLD